MLLLWLFGMGAGVANACLTTGQTAAVAAMAGHIVSAVEIHHDAAPRGHAQADGAVLPSHTADGQGNQGDPAKSNCQDFCDKATVSIPPLKSALDDVQSHAAIVMTAMTVLPMPAFAPVKLRVPRRDGVLAPPIPIAFLRLAL